MKMGTLRTSKREPLGMTKYPKLRPEPAGVSVKLRPSDLLAGNFGAADKTMESGMRPPIIEVLNMADYTHNTTCQVNVDDPIFQPFPTLLQYEKFEALEQYESVLSFRNNDTVARRIKILPLGVPFLSLTAASDGYDQSGKVAPGMEIKFLVKFAPTKRVDYKHDIVVCTEREKFVVPFRAIGARAVFDFPDKITFDAAPVKCASTKTILVRNVGETASSFTLDTDAPFSIEPSAGFLAVGESMQVQLVPLSILGTVAMHRCPTRVTPPTRVRSRLSIESTRSCVQRAWARRACLAALHSFSDSISAAMPKIRYHPGLWAKAKLQWLHVDVHSTTFISKAHLSCRFSCRAIQRTLSAAWPQRGRSVFLSAGGTRTCCHAR